MHEGIKLNKVSFSYRNGKPLLNNLSLEITRGTFYAITGLNGSGKTTFALLLNGLIPHEIPGKLTGDVFIDGVNTRSRPVAFFARKVGMVFQNPDFMLFNLTVAEEIAFGLNNLKLDNQKQRINKALNMLNIEHLAQRDPHTLSYGEKQKAALACILAIDTPYIILDEPVAMLDYRGAVNLYQTLAQLNNDAGKTIIVVEHDTDFILAHAQKTIILNQGQIYSQGDTGKIFSNKSELNKLGIKIPHPL